MERESNIPRQWTIKAVLEWTAAYFTTKGIPSGRLDAELLLAYCLGVDRLHLYMNLERPLARVERDKYRALVRRRATREPVALITGKKEFWSIEFRVVPGVLIPRPDTETLVEAVLAEIRNLPSPRILEIGTGSGAVAISLLSDHQGVFLVASDVCMSAIETARHNAQRAQVDDRLELISMTSYSAIRDEGLFDIICSNPPYIPTAAIDALEPEIRQYEPLAALDGGKDGLDIVRGLILEAPNHLKETGSLFVEIGEGQADEVERILLASGMYRLTRKFRDLAGTPRVIQGKLHNSYRH